MSLESGSYLSNLVSSNPTGADRKLQGDDHLRLIKSTLQNSFAGITGAVVVGGVNGGVANTYTLTPTPPLVSYVDNMSIVFSPTVANTGASTINVSGLGAVSIQSVSGAALAANDLVVGQKYRATFDGTNFRLFSVTKNYVDQLAFSSALPAQSLGFLASTGSVAAFTRTFSGYAVDESKGANVASASTIDLQNTVVTGNLIHITGTTTITAITLPSGAERTLVFDGILTLTHNATTLILPTGANITTGVGDIIKVRGDGSGNARVVSYERATGYALKLPGMELIAGPLTPSASANVDFLNIFTSTYDDYMIVIDGILPSVNALPTLRFAVAGVVVTTNNYAFPVIGGSAGLSTSINLTQNNVLSTGVGCNITINVQNANNATQLKSAISLAASQDSATPTFRSDGYSGAFNGGALTGFRLFWSAAANFQAQGSIKVYGISKV